MSVETPAVDETMPTVGDALPADPRSRKALQDAMLVLPDHGAAEGVPGYVAVYPEHGDAHAVDEPYYLVDVIEGACRCPDHRYHDPDGGCAHLRRAAIALGYLPVPAWVTDRSRLDSYLRDELEAL